MLNNPHPLASPCLQERKRHKKHHKKHHKKKRKHDGEPPVCMCLSASCCTACPTCSLPCCNAGCSWLPNPNALLLVCTPFRLSLQTAAATTAAATTAAAAPAAAVQRARATAAAANSGTSAGGMTTASTGGRRRTESEQPRAGMQGRTICLYSASACLPNRGCARLCVTNLCSNHCFSHVLCVYNLDKQEGVACSSIHLPRESHHEKEEGKRHGCAGEADEHGCWEGCSGTVPVVQDAVQNEKTGRVTQKVQTGAGDVGWAKTASERNCSVARGLYE